MSCHLLRLSVVFVTLISLCHSAGAAAKNPAKENADHFFGVTNVWDVHLKVSKEQWQAIEPKRTGGGGGFGFGGRGGPGGLGTAFEEGRAKRPGVAGMIGLDFEYVKADIEIAGETLKDVGLRYKGNGTYMQSQGIDARPFKLDFNKNIKGQAFKGLTKLNLHNQVTDPSYMHEVLSYAVFREAGVPAPRTAYVRVYLTVPGEYNKKLLGLYVATEATDEHFLKNRFGTKKGMLLKPGSADSFSYRGDKWKDYEKPLNVKIEEADKETARRVIAFLKLLNESKDDQFEREIGNYVDLPEFAKFLAVYGLVVEMDSILAMGQNYLVYVPETGKMVFMPWDLDHSFGSFFMIGSPEQRKKLSIDHPYVGEVRLLERLLKVASFKKMYREEMQRLVSTVFKREKMIAMVDAQTAFLKPIVSEVRKSGLARFEYAVNGGTQPAESEDEGGGRFGGRRGGFRGGPGGGLVPMKEFLLARTESVEKQLAGTEKGEIIERGGFGGPGGPGGRRGGGGFGPGNFVGPQMFASADANKDGKVTKEEFLALASKWYATLDPKKAGKLNQEQFADGFGELIPPPEGFGGPPGGGGGGPGAPGGGQRGGFGPGRFLAPSFFTAADANKDGNVTSIELVATFERWFGEWDKDKNGSLNSDELRDGLNAVIRPPDFGGGGPGGPGGRGGGPPF